MKAREGFRAFDGGIGQEAEGWALWLCADCAKKETYYGAATAEAYRRHGYKPFSTEKLNSA